MKRNIQPKFIIKIFLVVFIVSACHNIPGDEMKSPVKISTELSFKPTAPEDLPPTWTPDVTPTLRRWPTITPEPTNTPRPTPLPTEPVDMVINDLSGEEPLAIKSQLAYASYHGDQYDIYLLTEGNPEPELFIHSPQNDIFPTWSPDGKSLAYLRAGPDPQAFWQEPETDLYLVQNLVQTNLTENLDLFIPELVWSPNSYYIAFTGSEKDPPPLTDASLDIYIANVDTKEATRIINTSGVGCQSLSWSPDNLELVSRCRGSMVSGLAIDNRSGENTWFTDFIPAYLSQWLPSGETIMVYNMGGRLVSIDAEYMRQRDDQTYPNTINWNDQLMSLGYQDKAVRAMKWYSGDDNLFMLQSDDMIQVVDLNQGEVISILSQFRSATGDDWDLTGQLTWGPQGEQIAFSFFDGNDAEIGIVNIRTLRFSKLTDNTVDDLMPSWKPLP
jgi:dipeptidyl aminopeptidase/acylaminoacyl peptidase